MRTSARNIRCPNSALGAGRDLAGVRKVVLDAVHQAQGQGCAPGILGVAIGGDRGSGYLASKETLFQKMEDANPNPELAALEERLTDEANQLGIGPMGFGGKTTVLGTKITAPEPPARQLLRDHLLHVLGLPPATDDLAERRSHLSMSEAWSTMDEIESVRLILQQLPGWLYRPRYLQAG